MGSFKLTLLPILLLASVAAAVTGDDLRTFIVHVHPHESHVFGTTEDRTAWYRTFLPEDERLVHSYHHVASGFAARLTKRELDALSAMPGFVAAVPNQVYRLLTTHTPQFLGLDLPRSGRNYTGFGEGVIIGVLDSGIYPFHPSFSGDDMPPPPAKWKGRCDFNASACNNKLIGARSFESDPSPLDQDGHGTHTSSTAAGALVPGAQVLGQGSGTASGIAPRAHVAMYKVCGDECSSADILAGIDAAVGDGCDVISMSLGGPTLPFYKDSIAIGTFGAVEKGIFVSLAAGNDGPSDSTLSNDAPWMLTVAAGTMDRLIAAQVHLGNGATFDGESVFQPNISTTVTYPLVYAGASSTPDANLCGNGSLDGFDVKGKIVLCDRGVVARLDKGAEVKRAGGFGMILANQFADGYSTSADAYVLPASHVSYDAGVDIKKYINSTANPVAQIIFKGTILGTSPAPAITSFSSRGPSVQNPGILKPDITGPGVSVLAAWPFQVGPPSAPVLPGATFNFESGTSMSTPHLSGIAALIKSKHPDWSPAAIKSAIMTTADPTDKSGKPIVNEQHEPANWFATGAGQVNPDKALDPGLVYDIAPAEYIGFLCGMYTSKEVSVIARRSVDCSTITVIPDSVLNYPSISLTLPSATNSTAPVVASRALKNVGEASAVYSARVDIPGTVPVKVTVTPSSLQFTAVNQVLNFTVSVWREQSSDAMFVQGSLVWASDKHAVRSPVSISLA
ncbi:Subtilisin-like protease SBT1.2 [Dichanthelium oligosanthes]|uniref:Subtilisin-like protease SBT1.2 n=1 Tax=Dichanthelium oligosanthes TaxID=888268 RepID=A0A1E5UKG0_9POAL|nr:Subtilisin-like protease SBT1.2 [Dichanthelium oligosanthes]